MTRPRSADRPPPPGCRYPHLRVVVPNRPVRALSPTVLIGLGCERLQRAGAGDFALRTFLDEMIAAGEPPPGGGPANEWAAFEVLRDWFGVTLDA